MIINKENPLLTKVCVLYLYSPDVHPKLSDDKRFSVDVCIVDEDGMHGVGYYSFKTDKWVFHIEPYSSKQTEFYWYYPAINKESISELKAL